MGMGLAIENVEWEVIPFLRGLSFDGKKGLFLHAAASRGDGSSRQCLAAGEFSNTADLKEAVKASFRSYVAETGSYPDSLHMESAGITISFGADYEEACGGKGPSAAPQPAAFPDRGDVVRNRIVVVTGGAQGFGEGMVRSFAEYGAFVVIADMNEAGARTLADEMNRRAGKTVSLPITVNVTDEDSVERMIKKILREVGGIDLFVSNAGVLRAGSVKEMSLRDFNFVTSVDYTGFFICTKFASRVMGHQHEGNEAYLTDIVAISSKSGLEGSNKNGAYAGAKFGTIGLVQSFALELIADGIKVNAICPGNFLDGPLWSDPDRGLFVQYLNAGKVPGAKTIADVRRFYEAKVPMNRGCTTADVMKAVLYIVEQEYETGQAVPVTGGQVMLN